MFVLDIVFPIAEGRTDSRGIAVLRAPADAWVQWIVGAKPGVGFDYFENYRSWPSFPWNPPPRNARLVLDGARTVRVRAVDSKGRPVRGLQMYALIIQKKGKLRSVNLSPLPIDPRTDASGVATFDWLPAQLQFGMEFYSAFDGPPPDPEPGMYTGPASPAYYLPDPPTLDPNKPDAELKAVVLRATRLSGKLTRPDGSPASGIRVEANGVGGTTRIPGGSGRTWTAADGTYAMDVPPGESYMIGVIDDEWAAPTLSGVVVREGVPQTGLDLSLVRGSVVHGRVTAGPGSTPLSGRLVTLNEDRTADRPGAGKVEPRRVINIFMRIADSDGDGRYAFRVAPGRYRLSGTGPARQPGRADRADGRRRAGHPARLPPAARRPAAEDPPRRRAGKGRRRAADRRRRHGPPANRGPRAAGPGFCRRSGAFRPVPDDRQGHRLRPQPGG